MVGTPRLDDGDLTRAFFDAVVAVPNAAVGFTGGDAAFYAEGNATALAERLDGVLTDPELREQHLHAGWKRYQEKFTNEAIEAKFAGLFDELLAG